MVRHPELIRGRIGLTTEPIVLMVDFLYQTQIRDGAGRFTEGKIEGIDLPRSMSFYPKDVVHICHHRTGK